MNKYSPQSESEDKVQLLLVLKLIYARATHKSKKSYAGTNLTKTDIIEA